MRDCKKVKVNIVAHIGVGGAERLHLHDRWTDSLFAGNTIQRPLQDNLIYIGKVSVGQFGNVYYEQGLAPTICAGTHGYCIGHILVRKNEPKTDRWNRRNKLR